MEHAYIQGFLAKCAEYGIDPHALTAMYKAGVDISEDGTSFTLSPGESLGHARLAWNRAHPDQPVSLDQLRAANEGVADNQFRAGKPYALPAMSPVTATQPVQPQQQGTVPPPASQETPENTVPRNWKITDPFRRINPAWVLAKDAARTQGNRFVRWVGGFFTPKAKEWTPLKGEEITHMGNDQMDWLRMAIQAKYGDNIPASGSFGGARRGLRSTDDYRTYVHPGFGYASFPRQEAPEGTVDGSSGWSERLSYGLDRMAGVPGQIEYTLGDWNFSTDDDGNIVVNDTYDFNSGEGQWRKGAYGDLRRWAGRVASSSSEPDAQKTKFKVNLGKPDQWPAFDQQAFYAYNEPYRKLVKDTDFFFND